MKICNRVSISDDRRVRSAKTPTYVTNMRKFLKTQGITAEIHAGGVSEDCTIAVRARVANGIMWRTRILRMLMLVTLTMMCMLLYTELANIQLSSNACLFFMLYCWIVLITAYTGFRVAASRASKRIHDLDITYFYVDAKFNAELYKSYSVITGIKDANTGHMDQDKELTISKGYYIVPLSGSHILICSESSIYEERIRTADLYIAKTYDTQSNFERLLNLFPVNTFIDYTQEQGITVDSLPRILDAYTSCLNVIAMFAAINDAINLVRESMPEEDLSDDAYIAPSDFLTLSDPLKRAPWYRVNNMTDLLANKQIQRLCLSINEILVSGNVDIDNLIASYTKGITTKEETE